MADPDDIRQLQTDLNELDSPDSPDAQVSNDLRALIEYDENNTLHPETPKQTGIRLTRGLNSFHKMVAQFLAMGFTQSEVASKLSQLTGRKVHNSYISQLTRVGEFAEYLATKQLEVQEKIGKAIIQPQFQARSAKGLDVIDNILEGNFEDEKRARLQLDTVRLITEHGFGKPTQRSEMTVKRQDPHQEALEIDQQLLQLEAQIKAIETRGVIKQPLDNLDDPDTSDDPDAG